MRKDVPVLKISNEEAILTAKVIKLSILSDHATFIWSHQKTPTIHFFIILALDKSPIEQ